MRVAGALVLAAVVGFLLGATPPPSSEQLACSDALIRQQVLQLQGVLRS